nr:sulfatase-like hydrolase/transferase [Sulfitobacter maritimus]
MVTPSASTATRSSTRKNAIVLRVTRSNIVTDKTVEYLEHRAGEEDPFFAFVPYNGPYGHWPAIEGRADNGFAELYDDADMHSIPREGLSSEVLDRFGLRVQEGGVRDQFKGPLLLPNNVPALRNYFSQVSLIDDGVGRIMTVPKRLDLDQDTIVIYTADHGFSLGHNGIWGHGAASFPASAHRPSYHIPLIVSGGRRCRGRRGRNGEPN